MAASKNLTHETQVGLTSDSWSHGHFSAVTMEQQQKHKVKTDLKSGLLEAPLTQMGAEADLVPACSLSTLMEDLKLIESQS